MKTYKPGQLRPHPIDSQIDPENRPGTRTFRKLMATMAAEPRRLRNLSPRATARARKAIAEGQPLLSRAARALDVALRSERHVLYF